MSHSSFLFYFFFTPLLSHFSRLDFIIKREFWLLQNYLITNQHIYIYIYISQKFLFNSIRMGEICDGKNEIYLLPLCKCYLESIHIKNVIMLKMLLIITNIQKTHYIKHVKYHNFLHLATLSCYFFFFFYLSFSLPFLSFSLLLHLPFSQWTMIWLWQPVWLGYSGLMQPVKKMRLILWFVGLCII